MGANILLEPAQLGAIGEDASASVKAGMRWRRLDGREEGVGGLSGLGGRGALLSPVGGHQNFCHSRALLHRVNADSAALAALKDLSGFHQHSQQRQTGQLLNGNNKHVPIPHKLQLHVWYQATVPSRHKHTVTTNFSKASFSLLTPAAQASVLVHDGLHCRQGCKFGHD